jgi:hypothetical protein
MIHDADRSLEAWLSRTLPPGVGVRFDAPDPGWARRPPERPFVNVFLYDIAEDIDGLTGDSALMRDPGGRGVAWQPPVRRYRLCYLLTAWSADVTADHELLGSVMAGCAAAAIIPADCLRGSLLEAGLPVQLRCAPPRAETAAHGPAAPGTAGLCQALGVPPRAALTLVVVAPVVPVPTADVAPPARSLDLNAAAMARGTAAAAAGTASGTPSGTAPGTASGTAPGNASATAPGAEPERGQRRRWERARITERPR